MALDERSRHELFLRLEETLGPEAATTLMEHLPPVGWADVATKRDLDQTAILLRSEIQGLGDQLRSEFYRALADQTRTILLTVVSTTIGAVIATATLTFAAARLT